VIRLIQFCPFNGLINSDHLLSPYKHENLFHPLNPEVFTFPGMTYLCRPAEMNFIARNIVERDFKGKPLPLSFDEYGEEIPPTSQAACTSIGCRRVNLRRRRS
jgi:hypothetical protein